MVRVLVLAGAMTLATGCFQEVTDVRDAANSKKDGEFGLDDSECRVTKRTGCFQGQVTSAQDIRIKGNTYFDAASLSILFKELLTIKDGTGAKLTEDKYELTFLEPFDNRNFASGMEVHMKGDRAKSGRVMRSGKFSIHELAQGEYDIRVQKTIPFQVTYSVAGETKEDGTAAEPKVTAKTFCATLYSDSSVEIRAGQRASQVFDEYDVYLLDQECGKAKATTDISM